jgi:hypothetical protein
LFLPRWLDGVFRWLQRVDMVSEYKKYYLGGTESQAESMEVEYRWVEIGYAEFQDEE